MEAVFLSLVRYSIMASWMIMVILCLRIIFRNSPKWIFCILWLLVAIRLAFPFNIESRVSLIPQATIDVTEWGLGGKVYMVSGSGEAVTDIVSQGNESVNWSQVAAGIWSAGTVIFILYLAISSLALKHKLSTATLLRKGVKQSEYIDSAFVFGIIKPIIYVPYNIKGSQLEYVLMHEQVHIKRRDYLWKMIGFLLLAVYWFNPFIWIAYVLMCRDIEGACDEKVIKDMENDERQRYSLALLDCSVHRRFSVAHPIAFGEVNVKKRIKNIINYKKNKFSIIIISLSVVFIVAVCFLTSPISKALTQSVIENNVYKYPIYPGDKEWAEYEAMEKNQMLQIPGDVLNSLTTQDLVKVVIDYPFLSDIFYYDSYSMGFKAVAAGFNGLAELLKRQDAPAALAEYYKNIDFTTKVDLADAKAVTRNSNYNALEIILAQPEINDALSDEQLSQLENIIRKNVQYRNSHRESTFALNVNGYFEALEEKK